MLSFDSTSPLTQATENWINKSSFVKNEKPQVFFTPSTTSTNDWCKEHVRLNSFSNSAGALFFTEHQTAGRGRGSNTWLNDSATPETRGQLLSTWLFPMSSAPQPVLTILVGLALYDSLQAFGIEDLSLKAPNDIYKKNKKIAGLLVESLAQGTQSFHLVIGMGLNVFSGPELETAGNLMERFESTPDSAFHSRWPDFLNQWYSQIKLIAKENPKELSSSDQEKVKNALNKRLKTQNDSDLISEIRPDGSLHFQSGKHVHWSDL